MKTSWRLHQRVSGVARHGARQNIRRWRRNRRKIKRQRQRMDGRVASTVALSTPPSDISGRRSSLVRQADICGDDKSGDALFRRASPRAALARVIITLCLRAPPQIIFRACGILPLSALPRISVLYLALGTTRLSLCSYFRISTQQRHR